MKQEINPKETSRAMAFELWMKSPMPMVTLTKTFDVTQLCAANHWLLASHMVCSNHVPELQVANRCWRDSHAQPALVQRLLA